MLVAQPEDEMDVVLLRVEESDRPEVGVLGERILVRDELERREPAQQPMREEKEWRWTRVDCEARRDCTLGVLVGGIGDDVDGAPARVDALAVETEVVQVVAQIA